MGFRQWRRRSGNSKQQLRQELRHRNQAQRRSYVARQYEHLLFEPLEWRNLMTVTLAPISGPDTNGVFNVPSGKTLYVPLTGSDPTASSTVSYSASSSNPNVKLEVMDGHPTLVLQVTGTDSNGQSFSGKLTLELFDDIAPTTVQTIINYVNAGDYDNKSFYRVIQDFVIQGGLGQGDHGKPNVIDEFDANATFNSPGLLAMANPGLFPNTNTSEFFITDIDQPLADTVQFLNFKHTIFGQLTSGFDIYKKIIGVATDSGDSPIHAVTIVDASIIQNGDQNAVLRITAPNDFDGNATITVTASTSADGSTSAKSFGVDYIAAKTPTDKTAILINPVTDKNTSVGKPISFQVSAAILSGVTLVPMTVTGADGFRSAPQNVTVQVTPGATNATATVTLTPAAGFVGSIDLVLHADDNSHKIYDAMSFKLNVFGINSATSPINLSNVHNTTASGKGAPGATISVTAGDGTNPATPAQTTTVGTDGTWTISGIDVSSLNDGTITYTATDTTHSSTPTTSTATKDTVAPTVSLSPLGVINNTNKASYSVSGTGEVGATITLVISDGVNANITPPTVVIGAGGTWTISGIDISSMHEGTVTFTAKATDVAGNVSSPDAKTATKDTVAPAVDITTATSPVTIANVTTTSINGTAEAGATISLVVTDGTHSTTLVTTVATGGVWSFSNVDLSELNDGNITYQVTATDAAGNTATDTFAATKSVLAVTVYTNPINASNVTNAAISGTGEVGAVVSVEISDGTHPVITRTATVDSNGAWSITGIDLNSLNDGSINYKITATDSNDNTVVLNRTALKDLVAPSVTISSVTGPVNNGNKTNVTATGTGEVGATVSVVVSDGTHSSSAKTAVVDSNGNWSITGIDVSALTDGTITYTATITDAGQNTDTDTKTATKDTVAPAVTITTATSPVTPGNVGSVSVSGTGEVGATISVVVTDGTHSTTAVTATVGSDGKWSVSNINVSTLNDGSITYRATASDTAGNTAVATKVVVKSVADNTISGYAYVDVNKSNKFDSGDIRLKGVYVTLTGVDIDGNAVPSQVMKTDSKGFYHFDGLAPGTYAIRESQPSGFVNKVTNVGSLGGVKHTDAISQIVVTGGQVGTKYNFGEKGLSSSHVSINDFLASTPSAKSRYNKAIADGSTVSPIVTSIVKLNADPTEASTVTFRVTFNKNVSGVDASDFQVVAKGITGASIASVSGSGKTYIVTVNTGTGSGKIGLALRDNDSIKDTKKQKSLGGNGASNGDFISASYSVSKAPVVAINANNSPINNANKGNVTISGTGEVGATISLVGSDGTHSTTAKTVVVGSNGTWTITGIDATVLNDGNITFTATASNSSGKTSTATRTIVKDIVAPAVAVTTVTDPVNNGNKTTTSASGTGEPGSTVSVVVTDGTHSTTAKTAVVGSGGTWTVTGIDVTNLNNGTITYNVTATDTAGNTAQASKTATKDAAVPAAPVINQPGVVNSTNKSSFTVTGTGEAGAKVRVTINNGSAVSNPGEVTVQSDGTWTVAGVDLSAIPDGTLTYTVIQTDAAGNPSAPATITALKDTEAPSVTLDNPPTINAANQNSVSVTGTAAAGATITLIVSDGTHPNVTPGTVTADSTGHWTITGINVSSLADGPISFSVTAADAAGNVSVAVTKTTAKDTDAPDVAVTAVTDPIDIAHQNNVMVSGTVEPGATVSVVASDGTHTSPAVTATVAEDGTWSATGFDLNDLNDGTITFTATATDTAGNTATASLSATKSSVAVTSVTNPINAANQHNVSISGTAENNATIVVVIHDSASGTKTLDPVSATGGAWFINDIDLADLAEGTITFTVTATDPTSHTATITATVNKDTVAPAVAITSAPTQINNVNVGNITIGGTGEVGAIVHVVISGSGTDTDITLSPVTVDSNGNWLITNIDVSSLSDGPITFGASATDSAGNVSEQVAADATKNVVPPALAIGSVTNPIGLANQSNTAISGTGEAGNTIKVIASDGTNSTAEKTVVVDQDGNWSITGIDVGALADGTVTYHVTATNTFGNVAESSQTATKATVAIASLTAPINAGNQTSVAIAGTGEIHATVTVVISDGTNPDLTLPSVVINNLGNWSITGIDVSSLADGTLTFTVTATDADSHSATVTQTVGKDAIAPAVAITAPGVINAANQSSFTVSGTGEVGATVTLVVSDTVNPNVAPPTATVDGDGNWSFTGLDLSSLDDATITFSVTAADAAGNTSVATANAEKDVIAPAVTIDDAAKPINLLNQTAGFANGTGENGASINLIISDGVNFVTPPTTVVAGGAWSITNLDLSALADGPITYTVTSTDAVGNSSQASLSTTKDTVAPGLAITSVSNPINSSNVAGINVHGTGHAGDVIILIVSNGDDSTFPVATTVAEDGTWSFADVDVSSLADGTLTIRATATDTGGNQTNVTATANKDVLGPTVSSITLADTDPPASQTVHFTVVFSEAVTGVGASSFITAATGDVTGVTIDDVTGSGNTYTVAVSFTSGTGSLGLNVNDVDSIFDLSQNPLGGLGDHNGDFTGDFYTIA